MSNLPEPDHFTEGDRRAWIASAKFRIAKLEAERDQLKNDLGNLHGRIGLFAEKWWMINNNISTDETFKQMEKQIVDVAQKYTYLMDERDQLLSWKESVLAVEKEWDAQTIAKMLGGAVGQSCRKVIAEKVPELVAERDQLRADCENEKKRFAGACRAELVELRAENAELRKQLLLFAHGPERELYNAKMRLEAAVFELAAEKEHSAHVMARLEDSDNLRLQLFNENAALRKDKERLTQAFTAYIDLLVAELNDVVPIAALHGWVTKRAQAGTEARDAIIAAKEGKE